jgi:signal transduction histidine kinase
MLEAGQRSALLRADGTGHAERRDWGAPMGTQPGTAGVRSGEPAPPRAGQPIRHGASPRRRGGPAGQRLQRRTVRLRLTALYGALFLASGAVLLAITNILARGWPWPRLAVEALLTGPARDRPATLPAAYQQQLDAQAAHQHAAALNQLLAESAIALGVMAVASVALGWLVAGRVLRPLREMTATARAISEDNLSERLAVPGPGDELKELGDTIDGLLQRLETAFSAQRRFAANASHELRTPLAMMRTSLDVATAKPAPIPPELTVLAGKLREGLDQADRLTESLLLLARAEHGAKDEHVTISLGQLLADAIDDRAGLIARTGLHVWQAIADAWVTGNRVLLARMAGNLVDNATRHNQPGGWIRAETTTNGQIAWLAVENGGPVLDQDMVASLAEPFRRLSSDRTGSVSGTGLGLSIVEAVASAHGGVLRLYARPEGGLRAVVELPAVTGAGRAARPAAAGAVR